VITELKNRGVEQTYIAYVDGLKGFAEAITSVFPQTIVQLCIVHMVRNSLNYVPWKDRKDVAADLKKIYTAANAAAAEQALLAFKEKWGHQYPTIADIWSRNWHGIIPFLSFPDYIRKAIYTTNAIEAINRQIRKIIKTKGAFPNDEAVFKLVFLALQNASKKWTMPIREWKLAFNPVIPALSCEQAFEPSSEKVFLTLFSEESSDSESFSDFSAGIVSLSIKNSQCTASVLLILQLPWIRFMSPIHRTPLI